MLVKDVLLPQAIDLSEPIIADKDALFTHMAGLLYGAGRIDDMSRFIQSLYQREDTGSTYMGESLAVPHGKSDSVLFPAVALCRCAPFTYVSCEDEETVRYIAMLAIPEQTADDAYVAILANISRLLINEAFFEAFQNETDAEALIAVAQREMPNL